MDIQVTFDKLIVFKWRCFWLHDWIRFNDWSVQEARQNQTIPCGSNRCVAHVARQAMALARATRRRIHSANVTLTQRTAWRMGKKANDVSRVYYVNHFTRSRNGNDDKTANEFCRRADRLGVDDRRDDDQGGSGDAPTSSRMLMDTTNESGARHQRSSACCSFGRLVVMLLAVRDGGQRRHRLYLARNKLHNQSNLPEGTGTCFLFELYFWIVYSYYFRIFAILTRFVFIKWLTEIRTTQQVRCTLSCGASLMYRGTTTRYPATSVD